MKATPTNMEESDHETEWDNAEKEKQRPRQN